MPQATVANPSPLSFTPTSVMRKTAAERKDSDPRIHVPELKVFNQNWVQLCDLTPMILPRLLLRRRDQWHRQASHLLLSARPLQAAQLPRRAARREIDFTWNQWTTDLPPLISLRPPPLASSKDLLTSPLELLLRHTPTHSSTSRTTTWPGTLTLPCWTR